MTMGKSQNRLLEITMTAIRDKILLQLLNSFINSNAKPVSVKMLLGACLLFAATNLYANTVMAYIILKIQDHQNIEAIAEQVRGESLSNCKQLVVQQFDKIVVIEMRCDGLSTLAEAHGYVSVALKSGMVPYDQISDISVWID